MTEFWWYLFAAIALLIGFANLSDARRQIDPRPLALLFSFTAGYLAIRYGSWLWHDGGEHFRPVAVALVFCPTSLILGVLIWRTDGAFGRLLVRCVAFVILSLVVSLLAMSWSPFESREAVHLGLLFGSLVFLPWHTVWNWCQRSRGRRARRRRDEELQQREQQEIERQHQLDQRQTDLLQTLIDELRE